MEDGEMIVEWSGVLVDEEQCWMVASLELGLLLS